MYILGSSMPSPPSGPPPYFHIPMATKTTTTAAAAIDEIDPDVLLEALSLLDGPSLASASSVSSHLRSLCSDSSLWLRLCLSAWPSLSHPRLLPLIEQSPRHFFSDAYPFPTAATAAADDELPSKLVSAVDLYHRGSHVFSRVIETDTSTSWFRSSPFRISALEWKEGGPTEAMSPEDMTLSWIVIDPEKRRAVNVSSRKAVAADRRQWCFGETLVRFATVTEAAMIAVVGSQDATGKVVEMDLRIEDMDDAGVVGREGLRLMKAAMEAGRRGSGTGEEEKEAKAMYLEYLERKSERKKRKERREGLMDWCCIAVGIFTFLAFFVLLFFR